MSKPNTLLKVVALFSPILLAGGLVAYRAGAFQSVLGTRITVANPGDGVWSVEPEGSTGGTQSMTIWSGSKSGFAPVQSGSPVPWPSPQTEGDLLKSTATSSPPPTSP